MFDKKLKKPEITDDELKEIIEEGDAEKLNQKAIMLGEYYAEGKEKEKLSSSQIRNVLQRIQDMNKYDKNKLQLLRPLMAYAAGRHGGKVKELQEIVDKAIQMVDNDEKFVNFRNFFEAIVAYHRYYGGK